MSNSPATARDEHARRIVRLIYEDVADTRHALADATGMSPSLVSRVTSEMIRVGLLVAHPDEGADGPGRPAERLALRPDAGRTVGVESARDRLRLVVADAAGRLLDAHTIDLAVGDVSHDALARIAAEVRSRARLDDRTLPPLLGVGVALHDVVTADGSWMHADARAEPIAAQSVLGAALSTPVLVEDVSRAFAEAERRFGAGRDAPDMLYLFLGHGGVGSGIFADDVPLRASTGISGEIGHIPVVPDGVRCTCGNRGCLETVATHAALLRRARAYLDQGVSSELSPGATMHDLMAAARAGDKVATLVIHDLATFLTISLTGAVSVTGATTIVLGGDVRDSGPALPGLLTHGLKKALLQPLANRVEVRFAELPETAGAHGMAVAALEAAIRTGRLARSGLERGVVT